MSTNEKGEKLYNYLEALEYDKWARQRMEEPVEFDWKRICKVETIELDEKWDESKLAVKSKQRNERLVRAVVQCPNPRHNIFKMVIHENPSERELMCPHCITEEIDRIIAIRAKRDADYRKGNNQSLDY